MKTYEVIVYEAQRAPWGGLVRKGEGIYRVVQADHVIDALTQVLASLGDADVARAEARLVPACPLCGGTGRFDDVDCPRCNKGGA